MESLFHLFNNQFENLNVLVKSAVHIDVTLTSSPRFPHYKTTYMIAEYRKEDDRELEDIAKET